jgi:hypothetical protein
MASMTSEGWPRLRLWGAMVVALLSLVALGVAIRTAGLRHDGPDGRNLRRLRLQARLDAGNLAHRG